MNFFGNRNDSWIWILILIVIILSADGNLFGGCCNNGCNGCNGCGGCNDGCGSCCD